MSTQEADISGITGRSPAVDFVDNRMAEIHPAFEESPEPIRYSSNAGKYVPVVAPTSIVTMEVEAEALNPWPQPTAILPMPAPMSASAGPRQLPPAVAAMQFWDKLFHEAIASFKSKHEEPKVKKFTTGGYAYSVRNKANWAEVYDELQKAKTVYDGKETMRHVKKGLRVVVDKVRLVRPAIQLIPQAEYLSPVLGALQIIIDVSMGICVVHLFRRIPDYLS